MNVQTQSLTSKIVVLLADVRVKVQIQSPISKIVFLLADVRVKVQTQSPISKVVVLLAYVRVKNQTQSPISQIHLNCLLYLIEVIRYVFIQTVRRPQKLFFISGFESQCPNSECYIKNVFVINGCEGHGPNSEFHIQNSSKLFVVFC